MKGTVSIMDVPADAELPALSERVRTNNGLVPRRSERPAGHPGPGSRPSPRLRHPVLIAQEKPAVDEGYCDLRKAHREVAPARFGVARPVGAPQNATATPTHT